MQKYRSYELDFIKIIATCIIIFHHYQQLYGSYFSGLINFYNGNFYWGYIVELFFIVSGFFMYKYIKDIKDNKISFKDFFLRRYLRLLPMLFFGAILYEIIIYCYIYIYKGSWFGNTPSLWGLLIDGLGIQHGWGFADLSVNYPTWYCSVLLLMYIYFYAAVKLAKKYNISEYVIFIFLILIGCSIPLYKINYPFLNESMYRGLYSFFTGIIIAKVLDKREISLKGTVLSLFVVVTFIYGYIKQNNLFSANINYLLSFVLYPSIIVFLNNKYIKKIFSNKIISFLSDSSFCVFIIHNPLYPLLHMIINVFNINVDFNNILYMFLYLLLCWIIGIAIHYLIENPINKIIKKHFN